MFTSKMNVTHTELPHLGFCSIFRAEPSVHSSAERFALTRKYNISEHQTPTEQTGATPPCPNDSQVAHATFFSMRLGRVVTPPAWATSCQPRCQGAQAETGSNACHPPCARTDAAFSFGTAAAAPLTEIKFLWLQGQAHASGLQDSYRNTI